MFNFLKKKKTIDEAIDMMSQFRDEMNDSIVRYVSRNLEYTRANVGTPISSVSMLIAAGISDAHYKITSTVTKFSLNDFSLRQQHLLTGSLMYGLLINVKDEKSLNDAALEYAQAYKQFLGYEETTDKLQKQIREFGENLAFTERAARESSLDDAIQTKNHNNLIHLYETLNGYNN